MTDTIKAVAGEEWENWLKVRAGLSPYAIVREADILIARLAAAVEELRERRCENCVDILDEEDELPPYRWYCGYVDGPRCDSPVDLTSLCECWSGSARLSRDHKEAPDGQH